MEYSFNIHGGNFAFAQGYDVNASYKDLCAACDAVRYVSASQALDILDRVVGMERAIPYRRHNKHLGSRTELGGQKGKYPVKAAGEVRKVVVNALANASNLGLDSDSMVVVHAAANKTHIETRYPSKGGLAWGRGMYGRSAINHSDLEYAKIEIVLGTKDDSALTKRMKYMIKKRTEEQKRILSQQRPGGRVAAATAKKPAAPAKKATDKKAAEPAKPAALPATTPKQQPKPPAKPAEQKKDVQAPAATPAAKPEAKQEEKKQENK
ncbi:MAG: 50S ribosomal protein L22 [Candidatus Micrarchaeota archaeon]|nr:50S ribosomal protein L22 [Candidatus Micrarchaeota archaeon]